jgi:hypothetical protein
MCVGSKVKTPEHIYEGYNVQGDIHGWIHFPRASIMLVYDTAIRASYHNQMWAGCIPTFLSQVSQHQESLPIVDVWLLQKCVAKAYRYYHKENILKGKDAVLPGSDPSSFRVVELNEAWLVERLGGETIAVLVMTADSKSKKRESEASPSLCHSV